MRTTVDIPDALLANAKDRATELGTTLSALVCDALLTRFAREDAPAEAEFKLPTTSGRLMKADTDLDRATTLVNEDDQRTFGTGGGGTGGGFGSGGFGASGYSGTTSYRTNLNELETAAFADDAILQDSEEAGSLDVGLSDTLRERTVRERDNSAGFGNDSAGWFGRFGRGKR